MSRRAIARRPIPMVARVVVVLVVAAVGGVSAKAWALCPNCLGQTRSLTPTLELLGAFLLVPFVVAYAVFRAIRRHTG